MREGAAPRTNRALERRSCIAAPSKVVTTQCREFSTQTRFLAAISPQTQTKPTQAAPGLIPPPSGTRQASEVDRRRPEATGGDRRRPEATGGDRSPGGDRRRPEAKPEKKTRVFYSRRKNNNAKRLRPTAATTGRRRRSQRRLHAPTAIPPPLPPVTTATRDRAEENTSAEAEASGGGQRRTRKEYNTQRNQRQKQRQQRERREDRKKQTAHCKDRSTWWIEFHYETSDPLLGRIKKSSVCCLPRGRASFLPEGGRIRPLSDGAHGQRQPKGEVERPSCSPISG